MVRLNRSVIRGSQLLYKDNYLLDKRFGSGPQRGKLGRSHPPGMIVNRPTQARSLNGTTPEDSSKSTRYLNRS